jgi:hypothetical protein
MWVFINQLTILKIAFMRFIKFWMLSTVLAASTAFATPVNWTVTGATFNDGTSLTGSFTYDADTNTYSNWNLVSSTGTVAEHTYTPVNSNLSYFSFISSASKLYNFDKVSIYPYVLLNFASPLTNGGVTTGILTGSSSYEIGTGGRPSRLITAGTVVLSAPAVNQVPATVPTLSEYAMLALVSLMAMGGIWTMRKRRKG